MTSMKDWEEFLVEQGTEAAVTELAKELGSGDLDEVIHDVYSRDASNINNDGPRAQIECLIERFGISEAARLVDDHKNREG